MKDALNPPIAFDLMRDVYGFAVRQQHVQRYREYANIYKEEEEERSDRWRSFLDQLGEPAQLPVNGFSVEETRTLSAEATDDDDDGNLLKGTEGDNLSDGSCSSDVLQDELTEKEEKQSKANRKIHRNQIWTETRMSLRAIEDMMNVRVKNKDNQLKDNQLKEQQGDMNEKSDSIVGDVISEKGVTEEDSEDEFYDVERSDPIPDGLPVDNAAASVIGATDADAAFQVDLSWKEELEVLVRGGVPMALRGEDLPRTFPGHPALDIDGRNALRRILTAYARHNPSVGYCQAMNFFAAFLLLLMPEENAFWTFMGLLDDYFDGYYSEEMIEYEVDQFVFEELVRDKFPKLVNHLDYLGVQVSSFAGQWFLSIYMNMLPWESVLRVWDVLLFEGNRVMLFRTALALMELYGPALVTTKDAGDANTLLRSLVDSTFDSSQLVLTASMGFQNVNETRLRELRNKHRPAILAAREERTKGLQASKDRRGLASKLNNFKLDSKSVLVEGRSQTIGDLSRSESESTNSDDALATLIENGEMDSTPDLQDQVVWLKVELAKLLDEKSSALQRPIWDVLGTVISLVMLLHFGTGVSASGEIKNCLIVSMSSVSVLYPAIKGCLRFFNK
ncbi:TBC1 domain family member 9 [Linum perenne]